MKAIGVQFASFGTDEIALRERASTNFLLEQIETSFERPFANLVSFSPVSTHQIDGSMLSVTSSVLLQFRTYCGTATNRRFGPSPDSCTATNVAETFAFESFNGTHIHATRALVEEPSTAAEVDMPAISFWVNSGL